MVNSKNSNMMGVTLEKQFSRKLRLVAICLGLYIEFASAASEQVNIAYLTQELETPPALSNLDPVVQDRGIQGAQLAIKDNNTTGQFTHQRFVLEQFQVLLQDDMSDVFEKIIARGHRLLISNLPAESLSKLQALPKFDSVLVLDVATREDALRNEECQMNVLHLLPSQSMRTDALAQYWVKKRWVKLFLVIGPQPSDRLYAKAVRRSAKKFGLKIVQEKRWEHSYDARRTAQSEVPVFTQNVDYDVLMVADTRGLFGEYLAYRTWTPRLVAGTQGLVATSWHRTHEQWGAVQLQNRFREQADRWMTEEDYGAWLAVRAIGEAATRTQSVEFEKIKHYLLSEALTLAGFKGEKLTFRSWNGQLRQPVLLAAARSLVAVAPVEGFLHPINELDTLGFDQSESTCGSNSKPASLTAAQQRGQDNMGTKEGFSLWWEKLKKKLHREN